MGHSERCDDRHEAPEAPEWHHQTEEKQEVVNAIQDVAEAQRDEPQRRLMPPWIEPDDPGISGVLERPLGPSRGQESEHRHGPKSQVCHSGIDRKVG